MFPSLALRVIRVIDKFTGACIYVVMLLLIPLVLANVVEVLMRYVWQEPTVWAADMTVMTYGSMFMLGAAYTLREGRARAHRYLLGSLLRPHQGSH